MLHLHVIGLGGEVGRDFCEAFRHEAHGERCDASRDADAFCERLASAATPVPDLVAVDYSTIGAEKGAECVQAIRRTQAWCHVPVLALDTTWTDEALAEAYRLGVGACLERPTEVGEQRRLVAAMLEFWGSIAVIARPR